MEEVKNKKGKEMKKTILKLILKLEEGFSDGEIINLLKKILAE